MIKKTILAAAIIAASGSAFAAKPTKNITLELLGSYDGTFPGGGEFDDGAAEIVAYDPDSWTLFVINASLSTVDLLDISDPANPVLSSTINVDADIGGSLDVGGINSVAVNNGLVAIAVEHDDEVEKGWIVFYDTPGNFISYVEAGILPDAVTFAYSGNYALSANEGQPVGDYLNEIEDPEGSITVVDLRNGAANATAVEADFTAYNGFGDDLEAFGIRLPRPSMVAGAPTTVAQDLEPEYITTSHDSKTAWVTLQENNALAVVDIPSATVIDLIPLGAKDHSLEGNELDASNRDDAVNITNWPVMGLYMPDTIASFRVNGETYLVTANEGDAREYAAEVAEADCPHEVFMPNGAFYEYDNGECIYLDEARVKDLDVLDSSLTDFMPGLTEDENLGRLKIVNTEGLSEGSNGDDHDELYSFGARSFSIWSDDGDLVFDSGSDFEIITADSLPEFFNSTNDENNSFDSRSDDKGPEPEGLAIGKVRGNTYAFIGLERVGGVMIYDVSNPAEARYVDYINNRNFLAGDDGDVGDDVNSANSEVGDLGPEGLVFINEEDSPIGEPLLVTGNEVSGTTSVFLVVSTMEK